MTLRQKIQNWSFALLFGMSVGGSALAIGAPSPVSAACDDVRFLTFPTWYRGVVDGNCRVVVGDNLGNFIWKIVLNIIEILLQAVGYISVAFIIFGGFKFLTSAGSPDANAKGRKTIINAIVGLVISVMSVGIVNVIAGAL